MRYPTLLLLLPPLSTLTACGTGRSADVKQGTIEQSYALTYTEASAQMKASASFHYENTLGTSLKLTDGSIITFNDTPMIYSNPLNSASYDLDTHVVGQLRTPMEFRYVNNDGEVFVTQARVPSPTVIKTPHEGDHVRVDREMAVLMEGDRLVDTDELTLCLAYEPSVASAADPSVQECLHSEGPMSLVFSREQLARFPLGRELTLQVKRESHPKQNNPRIHLAETFLSKPLHLTLQ
ncbi:MAG TPA: hypothetical protein VE954_23330 [Oligoflexus sp.]|uniref:hypothetical protein n=1 Tax=Oligoflexus sp. TaxID=1971216 RepID=UPI002D6073C3|nr:hypothetical protein [Oligoflexus sp.]HYX36045.1 hypothetical protein [Oligoflexus sp.]